MAGAGAIVTAGIFGRKEVVDKDKIFDTFKTFKDRDEARVKELNERVILGEELTPDVIMMVLADRVADLSTLVAVIAKELTHDRKGILEEDPEGTGQTH